MKLSGATVAVPEGRAIRDSDKSMPLGDISATLSVPATPGESMAASGVRKHSSSELETPLERVVRRRVNPEPDSEDEDVIILSQPGTQAHGRADHQTTAASTVGHHIMSHLEMHASASAWMSPSPSAPFWFRTGFTFPSNNPSRAL